MVFTEKLTLVTSWKACFLLLLLLLDSLSAAPLNDLEEASLSESGDSSFSDDEPLRLQPLRMRLYDGPGQDYMGKRALSLFAHWKPRYRGGAINTRSDQVVSSIATRGGHARPLGQPLRWGK